jgi:hypothetical protein
MVDNESICHHFHFLHYESNISLPLLGSGSGGAGRR